MNAPRRTPRRRIDGVLLLDKPLGLTSNAVLQQVRRLYAAEKAGHTGTLDPMATGLLPLCFGEATKFSGQWLNADKTYVAELALGVTTDTADAEGCVLERRPVAIDASALEEVLRRFVGEIDQVPPMHSALKHAGRPLYDYARRGIEVERMPRTVLIRSIRLRSFSGDRMTIEVECGKGTYIRTLAADIGEALGCGAHLSALRRTGSGALTLSGAHAMEEISLLDEAGRDALLLPVDRLLSDLPEMLLDAEAAHRFMQGQTIAGVAAAAHPSIRVYGAGRHFLGLGEVRDDGCLRPRRLLSQGGMPSANA